MYDNVPATNNEFEIRSSLFIIIIFLSFYPSSRRVQTQIAHLTRNAHVYSIIGHVNLPTYITYCSRINDDCIFIFHSVHSVRTLMKNFFKKFKTISFVTITRRQYIIDKPYWLSNVPLLFYVSLGKIVTFFYEHYPLSRIIKYIVLISHIISISLLYSKTLSAT